MKTGDKILCSCCQEPVVVTSGDTFVRRGDEIICPVCLKDEKVTVNIIGTVQVVITRKEDSLFKVCVYDLSGKELSGGPEIRLGLNETLSIEMPCRKAEPSIAVGIDPHVSPFSESDKGEPAGDG